MRLKSPTYTPVHVALLSGHTISVGPEGYDVPAMFRKDALINGCIPCTGEAIEVAAPPSTSKTHAEQLVEGIKKYLEEGHELTGAGLPNRKVLGEAVGFPVTAVALEAAWAELKKEIEE
jgi:hypothetical protein